MITVSDLLEKVKNKRVMVLGSSGYIGSELVKELINNNIIYFGIDKLESSLDNVLCFNLCKKEKTINSIKKNSPDHVVHCGTYSALAYKNNFLESFREDAQALTNILEALYDEPQTRLLYLSSSYIYSGLDSQEQVNEQSVLNPTHNFGIAKSFFEQFILRIHPNSIIFRLSSVFGPGKYLNPNAITNFAKECMEQNKLTVWGSGSRKMQYVYNKDVVKYIVQSFSIEPGIYNLGCDEYISVAETAKMIAEYLDTEVEFLKDKKEGETLPFMDNTKLKKAASKLDFAPFSIALREYLKIYAGMSFNK